MLTYLQESHARRRLDCCQSGAIGREFRGDDVQSSLAGLADPFGSYVLTASTAIQLAEEREKDGHGVFTEALIDCLREPRKENITFADLYSYASERLRVSGSQKPMQWALDVEGSPVEIGNFRQRLAQMRWQEVKQLISTAREKPQPYVTVGALIEEQVESIVSDSECDDVRLLPSKRMFRLGFIRFLKGEASFLEIFSTGKMQRPEPAPNLPEYEVSLPIPPAEAPSAKLTVTPPEPAPVEEAVSAAEPPAIDPPIAPPAPSLPPEDRRKKVEPAAKPETEEWSLPPRTLTSHKYSVSSVAFAPDGRTLASGSTAKTIKLWDVSNVNEASK